MAAKTKAKNVALPLTHEDIPRFMPKDPVLHTTTPSVIELARRSQSVLGYTGLREATGGAGPTTTLAGVLASLGIEALNHQAVEKYKLSKTRPDRKSPKVQDEEDTDEEARDNRGYRWWGTDFSDYSQPMPERVLAKAVQIKEALPEVTFVIHHLARYRDEISKDPFLEVKFKQEKFYIEVWDEPNFTNTITSEDAERAGLKNPPTA